MTANLLEFRQFLRNSGRNLGFCGEGLQHQFFYPKNTKVFFFKRSFYSGLFSQYERPI